MTSYSEPVIWALICVIGVLTFLIRLSFIGLFGYFDELPTWLERALRFVPAAVLAALVLPAFIVPESGSGGIPRDKLAAGLLAAGVAWQTESVLLTIGTGMVALWLIRFALLPIL